MHMDGLPFGQQRMYDTHIAQNGNKGLHASHMLPGTAIGGRRRLNFIAMTLNVMVPWLVFLATVCMMSFTMRFHVPNVCYTIIAVCCALLAVFCLVSLSAVVRKQLFPLHFAHETPTWLFFFAASTLIAVLLGWSVGSRNYLTNARAYYVNDVMSSYERVDPATTSGQELMDAGSVIFTNTTRLDVSKSMGFKNSITYCVAPIVTGDKDMGNYDFWAVGINCCRDSGANFKCGNQEKTKRMIAGLRLVSDDQERAFYRLAVQQAVSVNKIKATHPLFFQWVGDPREEMRGHRRRAYRDYLLSVFAYFGCQCGFVLVFAYLFRKTTTGEPAS